MQKQEGFHTGLIDLAFENKDPKTVVNAYLDILNYQTAGLKAAHLLKVYESLNYESAIDHVLVEHLGRTATKLGFIHDPNLKLHQALYFYKVKGYLSAVDILKEIFIAKEGGQIANSEQLKTQFFASIFDAATEIDAEAKAQLVEAIKTIPKSRWTDRGFYGIEEQLEPPKVEPATPAPEAKETQQEQQ